MTKRASKVLIQNIWNTKQDQQFTNKSSSSRHLVDEDHGSTTCGHHPAPPPTTTCSLEGAHWGDNPVLFLQISAFKDQIYKYTIRDAIEVDHHKPASTRWFCQRATGRSQMRNCMNWCLVLRYIWVFALATQPALFLRISQTNNDSWWPNNSYVLMLTRLNSQGILCTSSDKVDNALLQAAGWKNKVFQTVAILANHEKVGTCLNQTRRFPCCVLSVLSTNETLRTNKLSRATKQNQQWKESYKW